MKSQQDTIFTPLKAYRQDKTIQQKTSILPLIIDFITQIHLIIMNNTNAAFNITHDSIIELVQAHKEGKEIELRYYNEDENRWGKWKNVTELELHLFLLRIALSEDSQFRIKSIEYRPWTKNEIPELAQYRLIKNPETVWFSDHEHVAHDIFNERNYLDCEYRTDLSKNEWYRCGIQIVEDKP